jgi:hypothetical protein
MSSIQIWCGRFGNNIQQISNAIFYCQENELNFNCPDNELIKSFNVSFNTINKNCYPGLYFFHTPSEIGDGKPDFNISNIKKLKLVRREICKNFIYNNLKINFDNIKELDDNILIMNVRSGDIFSRENYYCPVVSNYLQNPLKYYLDIIVNYDKVIVLTEDYENPIISELSKIDKVEIKILPIIETIELMLSTRNLVTSGVSSFPIACALLSKNIKKIYCSNLYLNEILNYKDLIDTDIDVIITEINQDRYIKWNEWLNTSEQKKIMLDYV